MTRSTKDIEKIVDDLGYILLYEYFPNNDGKNRKCVIEDTIGYKYNVYVGNLLRGNSLAIVDTGNEFSLENIALWLFVNNKSFILSEENKYVGTKNKLNCYCHICEDNFSLSWDSIFQGIGCTICGGKQVGRHNRLSNVRPDLICEWSKQNIMSYDEFSYGSDKKVWWVCSICNHEWKASINKRTISNRGCPRCKSSSGEKIIQAFLSNNNIEYISQHVFPNCKNVFPLLFDFYIPNYNLCIEYQGIQHYEPVELFGGKEQLKLQKKLDKIKTEYCEDNSIHLLKIPYWDFKNIERILKESLL